MSKEQVSFNEIHVPENIYPLIHEGGMVTLNSETGQFETLNRDGSMLLQLINTEGNLQAVYEYVQASNPQISRKEAMGQALHWTEAMVNAGLISPGTRMPREFTVAGGFSEEELLGAGEVTMVLDDTTDLDISSVEQQLATESLATAQSLMNISFNEMVEAIDDKNSQTEQPAAEHEIERDLTVLRQASRNYMGRIACLETAVGAALMSAAMGRKVDIMLGARVDPIKFHSWLALNNKPVRLDTDEQITGVYYPLFKI